MQLGFDFDWSGLLTGIANAGATYATAKSKIDQQTAVLKAQLAAQQQVNQQAQLAAQAGYSGPLTLPSQQAMLSYLRPASGVPAWIWPVLGVVGVGAVYLAMRKA